MNSFTKIKIIAGIVISILLLLATYMFINASNKNDDNNNQNTSVSLRSQKTSNFTLDEMMKADNDNNNYDNSKQDYNRYGGNLAVNEPTDEAVKNSEIEQLQAQLRANQNNKHVVNDIKDINTEKTQPKPIKETTQTEKIKSKTQEPKIETETKEQLAEEPQPKIETKPNKKPRFFNGMAHENTSGNSIRACVHGEQTVQSGGTLKMRLLQDMQLDNVIIPANTFIYGIVSFSDERLQVEITSVRIGNNRYTTKMNVYDIDAIKGIYVPDNIKSDARKEATGEAINNVDASDVLSNSNGNILTRTIGAVGNAVKGVIGRNTSKQKVTVKSNYEIYLQ